MRRSIALPSIVLVALLAVGCSTAAGADLDVPPSAGIGPAGSLCRRRHGRGHADGRACRFLAGGALSSARSK